MTNALWRGTHGVLRTHHDGELHSRPAGPAPRDDRLDRLRGLAILLMIGDHVCMWIPDGGVYRYTLGRLAMPLFFVLAGHLARRVHARHAGIALLGVGLPLVCPWLDHPNVLTWWAIGVGLLELARRLGVPLWSFVLLGLVMGANGFGLHGYTYEPTALFGLMAAGAMIPRASFAWAARLPPWLARPGRHPIPAYVGQAVAITAVVLLAREVF